MTSRKVCRMTPTYTTRLLTASEKGEQDEQCWRAAAIKARREAEAAQDRRAAWIDRIKRAS